MTRMMAKTVSPGAVTAAPRLIDRGLAAPTTGAARAGQDQQEGPEQVGERPPPFLARPGETGPGPRNSSASRARSWEGATPPILGPAATRLPCPLRHRPPWHASLAP